MSSEFNPDDIEAQLAKSIEKIVSDEEERAYGYEVKSKEQDTRPDIPLESAGNNEPELEPQLPQKNNKKIWIIVAVVVAAVAIIIVAVILLNNKKKDSYTYQYNMGLECMQNKDYSEAITYLKKATEYDEAKNKSDVRINLAKAYESKKEYADGINTLYTVLAFDEFNNDAIKGICSMLKESKDIDGLNEFVAKYTNTDGEKALKGYMVTQPNASIESGDYTDEIEVELTSDDDATIYYTLDNSEPDEYSEIYKDAICLGKGEHVVSAIAINDDGIRSAISTYSYGIKIDRPASPAVTPKSGNYTEVQKIVVTVPTTSKAYYTLDGTTPTTKSQEYTEPIDMPEGNTVFSVIIVDKYDQVSQVTKMNYTLSVKSKYEFDEALAVLKGRLKEIQIMSADGKNSNDETMSFVYYSKKSIGDREIYLISIDLTKDGNSNRESYWYGVDANNCETFTVIQNADGSYAVTPL